MVGGQFVMLKVIFKINWDKALPIYHCGLLLLVTIFSHPLFARAFGKPTPR